MRQNGDGREVNYQKWWTGCLEDTQRVAVLPYFPCKKKTMPQVPPQVKSMDVQEAQSCRWLRSGP